LHWIRECKVLILFLSFFLFFFLSSFFFIFFFSYWARWLVPPFVPQPWRFFCTSPALEVPTCTARSPHAYDDARDL
jgi:hypothetical protein